MVPPVNPVGQGAANPADPITALLQQMVANETRRTNAIQRPKTVPSRNFKCGEDFMNFISHYRECVKAAYNYTLPLDLPSPPPPHLAAFEARTILPMSRTMVNVV